MRRRALLTLSSAALGLMAAPAPAGAQTTPEASAARIRPNMAVQGVDGGHVGTVERVEGSTIALARDDPAAGGRRHAIPVDWVGRVDRSVTLTKTADEARTAWDGAGGPKP